MNEPRKLILNFSAIRPQLMSGACLALVVFITVLLFFNLILHGIFFPNWWPSFGLALAVLVLGYVTLKYGFSKVLRKRWLIAASVFLSIAAMVTAPIVFITKVQHILAYGNFYFLRDAYLKEVTMVPQTDTPRFIKFKWPGIGWEWLFFDERDGFENGNGVKSREWWQRAKEKEPELAVCDWSSMKFAEHFYRVSFNCEYPYSGSPIPSP